MRGLLTRQTGRHIEGRQTGVTLLSQLREYALLMRLDRPIGTLLLLCGARGAHRTATERLHH